MRSKASLFFIGMLITFAGAFLIILGSNVEGSFIFVFPFFIIGDAGSAIVPIVAFFVVSLLIFYYLALQMTHAAPEEYQWIKCENCGAIMPHTANYCANCGFPLRENIDEQFGE